MTVEPDKFNPTDFNQQAWNGLAEEGDKYFVAATPEQIAKARRGQWSVRITPQKKVPSEWLEPLNGRELLCLAGGGGQQGPILAAAGARVTIFDLSANQLARDRQIAERENLALQLVSGDMRDLGCFENETFDLILNPCSVCYCPDAKPIWSEAHRVLKPGGTLIAGMINPVYYLFDALEMDQENLIARHKIPYSDLDLSTEERISLWGEARPIEYGHTLTDLLGAQLEAGFRLIGFYEDGWAADDKLSSMIGTFFATRAQKPE